MNGEIGRRIEHGASQIMDTFMIALMQRQEQIRKEQEYSQSLHQDIISNLKKNLQKELQQQNLIVERDGKSLTFRELKDGKLVFQNEEKAVSISSNEIETKVKFQTLDTNNEQSPRTKLEESPSLSSTEKSHYSFAPEIKPVNISPDTLEAIRKFAISSTKNEESQFPSLQINKSDEKQINFEIQSIDSGSNWGDGDIKGTINRGNGRVKIYVTSIDGENWNKSTDRFIEQKELTDILKEFGKQQTLVQQKTEQKNEIPETKSGTEIGLKIEPSSSPEKSNGAAIAGKELVDHRVSKELKLESKELVNDSFPSTLRGKLEAINMLKNMGPKEIRNLMKEAQVTAKEEKKSLPEAYKDKLIERFESSLDQSRKELIQKAELVYGEANKAEKKIDNSLKKISEAIVKLDKSKDLGLIPLEKHAEARGQLLKEQDTLTKSFDKIEKTVQRLDSQIKTDLKTQFPDLKVQNLNPKQALDIAKAASNTTVRSLRGLEEFTQEQKLDNTLKAINKATKEVEVTIKKTAQVTISR